MAAMRSLLRILAVPVIPMLLASCCSWAIRIALRAPERRGAASGVSAAVTDSPLVVSVTKDPFPSFAPAPVDGQTGQAPTGTGTR